MTSRNDGRWAPSPELLAAYFDGEFEGRDDLAPLRQRLEAWLAASPGARAELCAHRRLRQLWLESTPPDPAPGVWESIQSHLHACRAAPPAPAARAGLWKAAALLAGAACILAAALLVPGSGVPEDVEPFPVASESEVVILHVEGADAASLVVGQLPVQGPMVWAGAGDVTLTSVQPDKRDNMVPEMHVAGSGGPIIWARAEAEDDD